MSDFLTTQGFLGTKATLRSDLTLVLIIVTAILFNIGFILARRKQYEAHRWVQTSSVILNSFVVVISRDDLVRKYGKIKATLGIKTLSPRLHIS